MRRFVGRAISSLISRVSCGIFLAAFVASCGGGGGASNSSSSLAPTVGNITGYVVEGPVSGATVKLYQLDAAGARTLIGSAVTDNHGFYSIGSTAPSGATVMVEASGGSYTDEVTGQTMTLSVPLRAASTSPGSTSTMSVTPYSEAAVRILEHAGTPDWSGTGVASANKKVADALGVTTVLDFIPVDLMSAAPAKTVRDNDVALSFFTSGFSGFAHRLDPNAASSLASALDGTYRMIAVDEHDDKIVPAFLAGVVDFVDHSKALSSVKGQLKELLLMGKFTDTPAVDSDLDRFKPTGVSSGGATAPMPDDAFQLVGDKTTGSMFNTRGALIAYPLEDGSGNWRTLLTASVADVFGDGDIGIGRWNGGTTVTSSRAGSQLTVVESNGLLPYGSFHYALARPVTNAPACGVRRLPLVASTVPTLASAALGESVVALGLTPDSSVSFQYATDSLVGFDIGVRAADGTIVRFRSTGGIDAPWASNIRLSNLSNFNDLVPIQAVTPTTLGMGVQGLASGNGENKLVLKIVLGENSLNTTELAAAFAAPTAGVDQSGCAAAVGDPGTAIDPAPVNGSYGILVGKDPAVFVTPQGDQVNFRARGELSSAGGLQVGATTPVYELTGNADASIGRIDGPYTLGIYNFSNSLPYAVGRAGASIPISGTRHYVLVASTSVVPLLAGSTGELPLGRVQSASLDVYFGESPIGTPSQSDGTAAFGVSGSVGGIPFSISAPGDAPTPVQTRFSKGDSTFAGDQGYQFSGVFAAPSGNYAVVAFTVYPGSRPAAGTLLFRAQ